MRAGGSRCAICATGTSIFLDLFRLDEASSNAPNARAFALSVEALNVIATGDVAERLKAAVC
jgi:hypothetical protein